MEMLSYDFMQRALIVAIIIGAICPAIGLFLVLRRLGTIGDTLAHISLAGVATGLLTGLNTYLVTMSFTVLAGLAIDKLRRTYSRYSELATAIMMAFGVGLASTLLTLNTRVAVNVTGYLFGSILAISKQDVFVITALGGSVLLVVAVIYRQFFYVAFDEEAAKYGGVRVKYINLLFTLLTALTITLSLRIVGVLLVSSLMVLPVATAMQIAKSFRQAFVLSIVFAESSVLGGLIFSYYLNTAPGGTIVLTSVLLLLGVLGVKVRRQQDVKEYYGANA